MRSRRGRFRCTGCLLDLDTSRRDWMGPVVRYGKRPCGYCGHMWVTHRSFHHAPVVGRGDMSLCRCPSCGRDNEIPTTQSPAPRGNHALDPYFGMPLLLQVEMPDGVLWAYNGSHLDALRGYVSAKLRERRGPLKSTMFARLPPWISSAKHREKVLKGIGRLAHLL